MSYFGLGVLGALAAGYFGLGLEPLKPPMAETAILPNVFRR
jgi:hypothetical protein